MKVLVIDDEKPTLSMFNLFLTAYGYEVNTAENGEKGLKLYDELSPDIVFTDIKMPGIDGLEVLRRIREKDIETQVIIITGHGDMEKAVEALDLEASDFINKPVERQALNSALARAEKRRQMPGSTAFSHDISKTDSRVDILIKGKLSSDGVSQIAVGIKDLKIEDVTEIHFIADNSFSINRSGISSLMTLIQDLNAVTNAIYIENLSFNYVRVFQMTGMDKLARLIEEDLPE